MRFLTGATGAMGYAIATALLRAGHEVVGTVRTDDGAGVARPRREP